MSYNFYLLQPPCCKSQLASRALSAGLSFCPGHGKYVPMGALTIALCLPPCACRPVPAAPCLLATPALADVTGVAPAIDGDTINCIFPIATPDHTAVAVGMRF